MKPEDISAAKGLNKILGVMLLIIAALPLWLVGAVVYYDGVLGALTGPFIFPILAVIGGAFVVIGLRVFLSPQEVGVRVTFHDTGFDLFVRQYLRRPKFYQLHWSDIDKMRLNEAPRGGNFLLFRLKRDAAKREGVAGFPARGNVTLPLGLCGTSIDDVVSRFERSAEHAGAALNVASHFDVIIFVRKVWKVTWS